jgi:Domain of unknown function (DUF1707)/Cell wall-active antibiotics response 4TMS YvqF
VPGTGHGSNAASGGLTAPVRARTISYVSDDLPIRASDADREDAIARLREHAVEGRLTLEEFTDRMTTAATARTTDELDVLARDLPLAPVGSRRKPVRFLFAMFGSTEREGRIRVGRRVECLSLFGNIDLDLRQATLESDVTTVVAIGIFGALDVYVPEGVEVDLHGFALGGHKRTNGNDPPPQPGTPLVRVFAISVFAGIDVWRVPLAWTQKTFREVIRGIRRGAHKELERPSSEA